MSSNICNLKYYHEKLINVADDLVEIIIISNEENFIRENH